MTGQNVFVRARNLQVIIGTEAGEAHPVYRGPTPRVTISLLTSFAHALMLNNSHVDRFTSSLRRRPADLRDGVEQKPAS